MGICKAEEKRKELEVTGKRKHAWEKYEVRVRELKHEGRAKPDMIACKELRNEKLAPQRQHGELDGVPIGLVMEGRGDACILGLHQKILSGIDAKKDKPCYAVCMSGGYADDDDCFRPDGSFIYTGEGGQDKGKTKQIEDQDHQSVGNLALKLSSKTGDPIRVLRGTCGEYHYVGLYRCVSYTYDEGIHGFKVFKFKMVPVKVCPRYAGHQPLPSRSPVKRLDTRSLKTEMHAEQHSDPPRPKKRQINFSESPTSKKVRTLPHVPFPLKEAMVKQSPVSSANESFAIHNQSEAMERHLKKMARLKEVEAMLLAEEAKIKAEETRDSHTRAPRNKHTVLKEEPRCPRIMKAESDEQLYKQAIPKKTSKVVVKQEPEEPTCGSTAKDEFASFHVPRKTREVPRGSLTANMAPPSPERAAVRTFRRF